MKTIIAQYCERNQHKCDGNLNNFLLAVNSTKHESTGFTSAYLNLENELRIPSILDEKDYRKKKT